jgi:hypothetical protein
VFQHIFIIKPGRVWMDLAHRQLEVYFMPFLCVCGNGVSAQGLYLEHSTSPFFVKSVFKIGSHELFASTGFEP